MPRAPLQLKTALAAGASDASGWRDRRAPPGSAGRAGEASLELVGRLVVVEPVGALHEKMISTGKDCSEQWRRQGEGEASPPMGGRPKIM